jgi:hypothetical protein
VLHLGTAPLDDGAGPDDDDDGSGGGSNDDEQYPRSPHNCSFITIIVADARPCFQSYQPYTSTSTSAVC